MKSSSVRVMIVASLAAVVLAVAQSGQGQPADVSKTFKVAGDCKISIAATNAATLADLKVGDKIRLCTRKPVVCS